MPKLEEIRKISTIAALICASMLPTVLASGGEKAVIQLKDFTQAEFKSGGFSLSKDTQIHLRGLGAGGDRKIAFSNSDLYAYGWIINAATRDEVWRMVRKFPSRKLSCCRFEGRS